MIKIAILFLFFLPPLFHGCSDGLNIPSSMSENNKDEDYSEVPINVKVNSKKEIILTNNSRIKINVYGLNKDAQDVSATLLKSYITNIQTFPSTFKMKFPKNSYKHIKDVPVQHPQDARYYLAVSVDIDGNGKLCDGDLNEDFSHYRIRFFNSKDMLNDLNFEIPLGKIDLGVCRDF